MSAIRTPVHAYAQRVGCGFWGVRDSDNFRLGHDLTEAQAKQISLALNLHDDLVAALQDAVDRLDDGSAEADEGSLVPRIRDILSRAETLAAKEKL